MTRTLAFFAIGILLASPGRASFESGGLLETGPRSAALGGATAADVRGALSALGSPAGLAFVDEEYVEVSGGGLTQASLVNYSLGGGTAVQGIGLSGVLRRTGFSGGGESALALSAGLPVMELPWLGIGAGLKWLHADFETARGRGFGFDTGIFARPPLPWQRWTLAVAAGIENALGEVAWDGGLKEDLSSLGRLGAALRWAETLGFLAEIDLKRGPIGRETIIAAGCGYSARIYGRPVEFRVGVRDGTDRETAVCAGGGLAVGRYEFDYALVGMEESQGYLHLFSARMILGARHFPFGPGFFGGGEAFVKPNTRLVRLISPYRTVRFNIQCPPARQEIVSWSVLVMDAAGGVIWEAAGEGRPGDSLAWNCVTDEGKAADEGDYCVQLVLRGANSFRYLSRPVWFRIERVPEARLSALHSREAGQNG